MSRSPCIRSLHPATPSTARSAARRSRRGVAMLAGLLVAAAAAWVVPTPAGAQGQPDQQPQQRRQRTPEELAQLQRFNKSIVRLDIRATADATTARSLGPVRTGTGVVLDDRTVLTIGYLTLEADAVIVTTASGRRIPASVAGYDHASGFGVIRTVLPMDDIVPTRLGDSDQLKEKAKVLTLGQGEPEATELVVLARKTFAGNWEYLVENSIFTFPPVNNWSGAALFTEDGALVGIGSLIVNDAARGQRGVPGNMYVPTNLIKPILADLVSKGRATAPAHPFLGVTTETVRGNLMVVRVTPNGPAEEAGVAPGDIILAVGPDKVSEQAEFYRKVWGVGPAGVVVPLRVLKDGDVKEVRVKSIDRMDLLKKATGI